VIVELECEAHLELFASPSWIVGRRRLIAVTYILEGDSILSVIGYWIRFDHDYQAKF
jgi:hypothetical protein